MNDEFRKVIDKARGDLSVVAFAEKCGVSANTIYRWLRGGQKTTPRKDVIKKIYRASVPGSVTQEEIYRASFSSIEGKDSRSRFAAEKTRECFRKSMIDNARDMYFKIGSIEEIDSTDDYMIRVNGKSKVIFKMIAWPYGSYHKEPETTDWWRSSLNSLIGENYLDPKAPDVWTHAVIVANTNKEAFDIRNMLSEKQSMGTMNMSVIIMGPELVDLTFSGVEPKHFLYEIPIGTDREKWLQK